MQELELLQLSHQISFMLDSLETEVLTKRTLARIQKDRILEMNKWAEEIKKVETEKERGRKEVSLAMIAANNHYADNYDNNVKVINKLANQTFIQKIPRNNSKIGKVISQNS